ncbi:MAG TPA: alpha/beta fold hydrolase [Xanthomonadaceae bacterium]|nr:alpha/beta fold hydrolase [Xanthomonadaceae bacterium]
MGGASTYRAPRWLRNPHLQSVLGSSAPRRWMAARALAATGAVTTTHVVDGGGGVRLQGLHSTVPGRRPLGLALLLHGWEGSADSTYMRLSAARLLSRGFDVFRLNFRDHGGTHHLNEGIFHSCLIDEVVHAAGDIARRFQPEPAAPLRVGGYSLGGNFALRLGLRAPAAGLSVAKIAAVCPVLDPAATMTAMERGFPLYAWYFRRKWTRSLRRKQALFPKLLALDDRTLDLDLRPLTGWLVERHTDLGHIDRYFDGYAIAGERLAALRVPADILTSADDPVIPVSGFNALRLAPGTRLEIATHGGHCGFLLDARLRGFAEHWIAERLAS